MNKQSSAPGRPTPGQFYRWPMDKRREYIRYISAVVKERMAACDAMAARIKARQTK